MAWDLLVSGVSQKDKIDLAARVKIRLEPNERSTMTFTTLWDQNYVPAQYAPVLAKAQDGVTPIYGGAVLRRKIRTKGPANYYAVVTCTDGWFFLDYTDVDLSYETAVSTKTVLTDILSQTDPGHGLSLHAGQDDGPMIEPFTFSGTGTEAVQDLAKRAGGRMARLYPDLSVKVFPPGEDAAPFTITDADPHCISIEVDDPTRVAINRVKLICGPTGVGADYLHQTWLTDGVATTFVLADTNVPASHEWPGVVKVDGINYPIWPAGGAPGGNGIEWDHETDDGTLSFLGDAAAFVAAPDLEVILSYLPRYPFTVIRASGATPVLTERRVAEKITTWAMGVQEAEALLDILGSSPPEINVVSQDVGWLPGQSVPVELTAPPIDSSYTLGPVTITLKTDQSWEYGFTAVATTAYQGSRLDLIRQRLGSGSSGGTGGVSIGGGSSTTTVRSLVAFLGGSHISPVVLTDSWQPISNAVKLPAQPSAFTGLVECEAWTDEAGVSFRLRLQDVTDDTTAVESDALTPGNDRNAPLEIPLAGVIAAHKKYQLQIIADDVPDEGKEAYVVTSTLAAAAA